MKDIFDTISENVAFQMFWLLLAYVVMTPIGVVVFVCQSTKDMWDSGTTLIKNSEKKTK